MTDKLPNLKDGEPGYKVVGIDELATHICDVCEAGGAFAVVLIHPDRGVQTITNAATETNGGKILEIGLESIRSRAAISGALPATPKTLKTPEAS